ncbi:hypothetical protein FNV43_RR08935 [Rhamnella rubrinervis]|uniref:Uncharacterized protein n=1 Tax=Rhamnella rubrinervis TaxID=2594499 RepID=A0A8K0MJI3_9ROSA|nr:hypothetical protein FNV43_RR08935 [Rhamnella rubrinervis]
MDGFQSVTKVALRSCCKGGSRLPPSSLPSALSFTADLSVIIPLHRFHFRIPPSWRPVSDFGADPHCSKVLENMISAELPLSTKIRFITRSYSKLDNKAIIEGIFLGLPPFAFNPIYSLFNERHISRFNSFYFPPKRCNLRAWPSLVNAHYENYLARVRSSWVVAIAFSWIRFHSPSTGRRSLGPSTIPPTGSSPFLPAPCLALLVSLPIQLSSFTAYCISSAAPSSNTTKLSPSRLNKSSGSSIPPTDANWVMKPSLNDPMLRVEAVPNQSSAPSAPLNTLHIIAASIRPGWSGLTIAA